MPGTLAERVRSARESAGLTQVEVAIAAGVSLTALRNIEQGVTTDPRLSTVERIFAALEGHHAPDATPAANGAPEKARA